MQYEDDVAFQRAILANPSDTTLKLVYADWLQERSDPRAEYVRAQVALPNVRDLKRRKAREQWLEQRARVVELGRDLPPTWVAFMTTLAQPFEPITFQQGEPGHPFTESVGHRGGVVVFASQYRRPDDWSEGLLADLVFLAESDWGECFYGAADFSMYGFVCELPTARNALSRSDVLGALKAADYQNGGTVPDTISAHTNFPAQFMFDRERPGADNHGLLRRHVWDGILWYVVLHIGGRPCEIVALLAVGRSLHGQRLVGALTRQMCHNLCD